MPKNTGLKLFTKTWPPKRNTTVIGNKSTRSQEEEDDEITRPLTATLDEPSILDINLIEKIDMSNVRKEFLNISNLCRFPLTFAVGSGVHNNSKRRKTATISRPLSLPNNNTFHTMGSLEKNPKNSRKTNRNCKKKISSSQMLGKISKTRPENGKIGREESPENSESTSLLSEIADKSRTKTRQGRKEKFGRLTTSLSDDNNNNKTLKIPRKQFSNTNFTKSKLLQVPTTKVINNNNNNNNNNSDKNSVGSNNNKSADLVGVANNKCIVIIGASSSTLSTKQLPEPCKACGRPDQPERFHSHPPVTPLSKSSSVRKIEDSPVKMKSTVQKPVAMKYKSKQSAAAANINQKTSKAPPLAIPPAQVNRKPSLPAQKLVHTPPNITRSPSDSQKPSPGQNRPNFNHRKGVVGSSSSTDFPKIQSPGGQNRTSSAQKIIGTSSESLQSPSRIQANFGHKSTTRSSPVTSPTSQNGTHRNEKSSNNSSEKSSRAKSAKRTLTCYICGREFGTASLHLHEPKCLQRWELENSNLPPNLRRKPPQKPDHPLTQEEWNEFAWESSQAILTPCKNCGRTFYPDRLVVHQRSCKVVRDNVQQQSKFLAEKPGGDPPFPDREHQIGRQMAPPPSEECYVCGKIFGKHSIKIHEKACLKKWRLENDALPEDIRAPEPVRKGPQNQNQRSQEQVCTLQLGAHKSSDNNQDDSNSTKENSNKMAASGPSSDNYIHEKEEPESGTPSANKKPPMFPCYICGRLFTVNSIYIHEPQCLKKWKIENDKLPPNKRRPQPLKPDIKFTHDGKIDYEATNDANWQSHLSQLVPCKVCSRTFNPDRVEKHELSCKG